MWLCGAGMSCMNPSEMVMVHLGVQICVLGFSLFIGAISLSAWRYPLKETVLYFNFRQQCNWLEALLWKRHLRSQDVFWSKMFIFVQNDDIWVESDSNFPLCPQVKDRRDCVKMHGSSGRLSRRWLGAGVDLFSVDLHLWFLESISISALPLFSDHSDFLGVCLI